MAVEDYRAPPVEDLLTNHVQWTKQFTQPKPLGIEKAVAIVTCMDGRVFPAKQFGLHLGDAEYIRNAGGRVTADVIRSLVLAIELLKVKMVIVVHHTDCGAQAAARHHEMLIKQVQENLGVDLSDYNMLPIGNSRKELEESVEEDVGKLRESPLISPGVAIYGYVYDTQTGELAEVVRSPSRDQGIQRSNRRVTREGLVGGSPSLQESQGRAQEEGKQTGDGTTGSEQRQGEGTVEEHGTPASGPQAREQRKGDDQVEVATSGSQGHDGSTSAGSGTADHASGNPESVQHLVEALKEAHVDDPDAPAAQI